jgi:hypothetical protein
MLFYPSACPSPQKRNSRILLHTPLFTFPFCDQHSVYHTNTKTNIYASSEIRTRDPSDQAAKTYVLDQA